MQKMLCCTPYFPSHFPSSSPSAQFQVLSLTHHGSHAILSHFTHHIHPSPLWYLLTSELPPQGGKRILHARLPLRCSCFPMGIPLGKTLDVCHHSATATPTVPSASALLLFLQALCEGSGRSLLLLELLEEMSPALAFLPSWSPASMVGDSC